MDSSDINSDRPLGRDDLTGTEPPPARVPAQRGPAPAESGAAAGTPGGAAETPAPEQERFWKAGRLEPMPIRSLPKAPPSIHLLGPTVFLVALGVGMGESYMWPRLVLIFGPEIRWLFLIGVTLQAVVMLEMSRYAMATGESIFFGAARVFKPLMWFFFVTAILVYIWPGHLSAGASAFERVTGIPWQATAVAGMLLVGVVFTLAKVVYNLLENVLSICIGLLVVGTSVVAAMVGSLSDLSTTLTGMFAFGYLPEEALSPAWFPVIVGSIAFAGPSGMQQMWYTLHLRDKGAGMGAHIPRIRGLRHAEEQETMPTRGFMFDTSDPAEMSKWKGWRRWVTFDAFVLFWGITMLVTVSFTVLAQASARFDPQVATVIRDGERDAALDAMAASFTAAGSPVFGTIFFLFISLIGLNATLGLFDSFSRGQADMTYFFVPGARRFSMSKLYGFFLWGLIAFGICILLFGPADGPAAILDTLAFLSTFAMGAYCVTLLLVNNITLPKPIRPGIVPNVLIAVAALFYLGMLFYSLFAYGVVVS
ncbi:Nramp family divalent metal transporter [Streptomonospora sp. S1-112]|uniref:Nramp family divalent metal transporter n=1 Tax=Streptomonospora mangrovi TaxID=2883123 RepID=A0A9X3SJ33_9ACTN|nr:Nramp family divalent metal transporter [Streptomonospora mangrovi]MDA0566924.1 Nramp family divalent metal transporter [Streptomonospora mangrovi]